MKKALIVLEKEWLELRLQPMLLLATLFLPPLITLIAILGFFAVGKFTASTIGSAAPLPPEFTSLSPLEIGQAIVGRQFSTLFLLLPIFIPSVLASYAIVGEKRERTLEPVLATPIRTWELLLGKMLAALLPALAITIASATLFIGGILAFAVSNRVRDMIVTPGWILAVIVDTPLLALIGVALIVVLSSRVNDPRTADLRGARRAYPWAPLRAARRSRRAWAGGRAGHRRGLDRDRGRRVVVRDSAFPARGDPDPLAVTRSRRSTRRSARPPHGWLPKIGATGFCAPPRGCDANG